MFGQHVCPHLIGRALLHCDLLLVVHSVPHKVIASQKLLRPRVVHGVVHDVDGRLAVHHDANWTSDNSFSGHLHLKRAKIAGLLSCQGEPHVLAFVAAE